MKKLMIALIGALVLGCSAPDGQLDIYGKSVLLQNQVVTSVEKKIDLSSVETVGNNSYIPLNIVRKETSEVSSLVLEVLRQFEEKHADLRVTSWAFDNRQNGNGYSPFIYGIWVHHEPKG